MTFGQVLRRCVYGTTGFIGQPGDLVALEATIRASLPVLREFRQVLVATNYPEAGRESLVQGNTELWRRFFPDCVLLDSPFNRGHSIGTSDLDNLLFDHCKQNGIEWLCKSANDVLLDADVLAIDVGDADFYFLNAVSYSAVRQHEFQLDLFGGDFFYPQTWFYVINVSATDFLVDKQFLDRSWEAVSGIEDYNGRIWEYLPRWSCEYLLRQCVERNGLRCCSLTTDGQFRELLDLVVSERIEDCSFKGLRINGIQHGADAGSGPGAA